MEPVLKRRLLIAIIIIALIIIFLPIPFGHFKLKQQQGDVQNIPPAPNQATVQSIPPSVDPITATVTPANTNDSSTNQNQVSGDPLAQTANNTSTGSNTVLNGASNTPVSNAATIAAAQNNVATSNTIMPAATTNVSMPAASTSTAPAATIPAVAPTNIAPAQSVSMATPTASSAPVNAPAASATPAPTTNSVAPAITAAVHDAAGNGQLTNMQPQSSLPDTDGSNTAPLAGDDVNLPPSPQIIDESQPSSSSVASDNGNELNSAATKAPAKASAASTEKPYHVRSDDVTSNNVTAQSTHHAKAAVKEKSKAKTLHKQSHTTKSTSKTAHHTQSVSHAKKQAAPAGHWIIQAASFPEKSQTQAAVNKLKAQGLHAFIAEAKVDGKTVYRAYVGPFISKEKADTQLNLIDKKLHTNAYVHEISK